MLCLFVVPVSCCACVLLCLSCCACRVCVLSRLGVLPCRILSYRVVFLYVHVCRFLSFISGSLPSRGRGCAAARDEDPRFFAANYVGPRD